ncbi:MAG: oligosaccharide flippase family protein [Syntrophaceae bacterium]|nr:oligosaccharide flippase family protein [Syntrophaceae bacterium]
MGNHSGEVRTQKIRRGSLSLLGSTGVTIGVGVLMAGILARYFSPEEFGMWAILMSLNGILINGFDFGFGNALRNKLAYLYGQKETAGPQPRIYFLSVFYWFIFSAIFLTVLFFVAKWLIPWELLFRSQNPGLVGEGSFLIAVGGSILAFNIAFNIFSSGFFGYQESHWNALFNGLSKLGLLACTLLFVFLGRSFFFINFTLFLVTLAVSIFAWGIFLKVRQWPLGLIPPLTIWEKIKELWRPSAQFAALQIFSTGLLNADYFVVSGVLGLETVGDYFLIKRVYLVLAGFHFALLLPIWSAYTEALATRDFAWIDRTLRITVGYTLLIFVAGILVMVLLGDRIIYLWTGKWVQTPSLFFWLGIWGLVYGWSNCFSVFLNGTGHLKWQVLWVVCAAFGFPPLAIFLGQGLGALGICLALIVVSLPVTFSNPLESFALVRGYRKGGNFAGS